MYRGAMGWNTCAIFVEASREVVLDAIAALCSPTAREIDFSEASLMAVVWSSVTSRYGFRFYENGALVRAVRYDHGEVASEEGDALPEEDDIEIPSWGPDEDWAFTIIERLTAIDAASRERASYLVLTP